MPTSRVLVPVEPLFILSAATTYATVIAASAIVEYNSNRPGRLRKKRRRVRTTSAITSSGRTRTPAGSLDHGQM